MCRMKRVHACSVELRRQTRYVEFSDSLGQSSGVKSFFALRSSSGCKEAFVLEIGVQRSYV